MVEHGIRLLKTPSIDAFNRAGGDSHLAVPGLVSGVGKAESNPHADIRGDAGGQSGDDEKESNARVTQHEVRGLASERPTISACAHEKTGRRTCRLARARA